MTSAQVVETSVNVTSNRPSQDYTHPDDHNLPNYKKSNVFRKVIASGITYVKLSLETFGWEVLY